MTLEKKPKATERTIKMVAEQLEERIKACNEDWQKPWLDARVRPMNISFRSYRGINRSLLTMVFDNQTKWNVPAFITFNKLRELNIRLEQGSQGIPIVYANTIYSKMDNGQPIKLSSEAYMLLDKEEQREYKKQTLLRYSYVFSVDDTNLAKKMPDLYAELLRDQIDTPNERVDTTVEPLENILAEGTYTDGFDILETKGGKWICPIYERLSDKAFYRPSKHEIVVPLRNQFPQMEAFYGTLLHEMAHSTIKQLPRPTGNFGDADYAREELVAEFTSAIVASEYGLNKCLEKQNIPYLKGWLQASRKEPDFLMSVVEDVNKISRFMINHISKEYAMRLDAKEDIKHKLSDGIAPTVSALSIQNSYQYIPQKRNFPKMEDSDKKSGNRLHR